MVHSSRLHALPFAPFGRARAQAADSPALRGPQPDPHPKRLGEDRRGGRQQKSAANVDLKQQCTAPVNLFLVQTSVMLLCCEKFTFHNTYVI